MYVSDTVLSCMSRTLCHHVCRRRCVVVDRVVMYIMDTGVVYVFDGVLSCMCRTLYCRVSLVHCAVVYVTYTVLSCMC